ncbi:protein sidekick-1 isoform X1 [Cyprinus carpio]|uniref:Protein sidekick-1 isoform X1 n=1 Tax=Cyprinus carpio TaxID=7962 RepID=A0A9Q9WCM7_CYPCA|nr:protein sidekick-1 isoform X1 [Cyprinus carpio]
MRKCSAAFYITLGFVSLWTTEASTGTCECGRDILNLLKNKCNNTEGVYDLACYIKHKKPLASVCKWKGDISTSYTLYTQQRKCSCVKVHQKNGIWTSDDFNVLLDWNLTAHVIESSGYPHWCTYKNFSAIPSKITMCGPHSKLTYKRSSGHLTVQVDWGDESTYIKNFFVEYKEFNTTSWKEQQFKNNKESVLWNLTSSLPYELRIRCDPTNECVQCPRSEVIVVPPELTDAPSIQLEIQDHIQNRFISPGQRKAVVKWEYANSEAVAYYNVTVRKVSGELSNQDSFRTEDSSLTMILSYSAYNISIRALNTAGSSPVSSIATEQMDEWRDSFGPFSVNITSHNHFSLSWNMSASSVCYSVEWWAKGQIPTFCPFYEKQTRKEITGKTESCRSKGRDMWPIFQPYTRYYFVLHTRPYPDTCNMKNVNNSETTYGTAQAYFTEGSPISAPGNVSIFNITRHSSVITWCPVSEEDLRGFLLGYYIYLMWDNNETSFTVDPSVNSYELQNLESNSAYRVQLSAFTAAGEGERSDFKHFVTNLLEFTALNSIIAAVVVGIIILLLAVHLSCRLLHRPNPENSNAVQKIEIAYELGILEPLNRQRLEESEGCDSSTVFVVGSKREASPLCSPPTAQDGVPTTLLLSEDEDIPSIPEQIAPPDTPTQVPTNESGSTETFPMDFNKTDSTLNTSVDEEITTFVSNTTGSDFIPTSQPTVVFMSDYTTMEIFQQVTMAGIQGPSMQTVKPGLVPVHPGQDYVRQSYFSQETVQ